MATLALLSTRSLSDIQLFFFYLFTRYEIKRYLRRTEAKGKIVLLFACDGVEKKFLQKPFTYYLYDNV